MVPIVGEDYGIGTPTTSYFAVAVARKNSSLTFKTLKGRESLATLEQEKHPVGTYLLVFFSQRISCRQTKVAMLIQQPGRFSVKAAYQVRTFLLRILSESEFF